MASPSVAEKLAQLDPDTRLKYFLSLSEQEAEALLWSWRGFHARPQQIAPEGDWDVWGFIAGRGSGKTRAGSEWIREEVKLGKVKRIAIIGETASDCRDVIVEGDSGILSVHPKHERPLYEPSKRRLTWPNGAIATLFNATEPDQLRGPQFDIAWCDELAKWKYAQETWDMLQFGLRLPNGKPRVLVTTTPRPVQILKDMLAGKMGKVVITTGTTDDNKANLAPNFLKRVYDQYAGTRLGRQELDGLLLGDTPGALWSLANIDAYRVRKPPEDLERIVVAVDPAVTDNEDSDHHGIVVSAKKDQEGYVLADASTTGSPNHWARRAIAVSDEFQADAIVVEVNNGGDMVANTIRSIRPGARIIEVRATRGKVVRAEPISSLYEQGRIHHVGSFSLLEDQMCQVTNAGFEGKGSPDRVDALVWGMTELFPSMIRRKGSGKVLQFPKFSRI